MSRSTEDHAGDRRRRCCLHQTHWIPDAVQGSPELTKLMTRYWLLGHARFAEVLLFESAYRTVTKLVKLPLLWSFGVKHENWNVSTCGAARAGRQAQTSLR